MRRTGSGNSGVTSGNVITRTTRTGREYLRVSVDRSGQARSVDEQHEENVPAAAGRGVELGDPYLDNNRSASRYATKTRDDFARLLADLQSGAFGADELWLWESSRGSRKVGEWVDLIDVCEATGVHIHVTTHGRTYDPANGRDRRSLLEDAVDSEYESGKTSARALRSAASSAAAGRPHGAIPFGFQRRYDPMTRKLVAQEPQPTEAPLVRELYDSLSSGHSLREIAADWKTRGVVNDSGRPFSSQHLRALALNPAYAGLRVHDPEGRKAGRRHARPGHGVPVVKGTWDGLVKVDQYWNVHRLLTDPKRVTVRPGRGIHLLSMISSCDVCGGPICATNRTKEPEYQCRDGGHVRVRKAELDEMIEGLIFAYLSRPDVAETLAAGQVESSELSAVRGDLGTARAQLDELYDTAGKPGGVSLAALARIEPRLLATIAELETRETELTLPPALSGLITPGHGVQQQWQGMPMSARRDVVRMLFAPGMLGALRIIRRPEGRRNIHVPVAERVILVHA